MSTIVTFPSNIILNRSNPMEHHNRFKPVYFYGGGVGLQEQTNLDYVTIPVVSSELYDAEKDQLKTFLDVNAGNSIVWTVDGEAWLGKRIDQYTKSKNGNVWRMSWTFYGAKFVL